MKSFFFFLAVVFSVLVATSALDEEDLKLRALLQNLCSENKERTTPFFSCCDTNNNGADEVVSVASTCFVSLGVEAGSIAFLSFYRRGLTTIPANAFVNFTQLSSLELSSNSLSHLPIGIFNSLQGLTSLDISYNSLTTIEKGVFTPLSSLFSLGLNFNSLTVLTTGLFEGLNSLSYLSINYNKLMLVEEAIFGENYNVPSSLNLNHNNLLFLPERFCNPTVDVPGVLDFGYNCLDCSRRSYTSGSSYCSYQSSSYCPTTDNCNTLSKFQSNNCFKCNSSLSSAFCDVCMPGYKFAEDGCSCVRCQSGDSCVFGEIRKPSATCSSCSTTNPARCSSCNKGAVYKNGNCVPCGEKQCCPGGTSSTVYYNCSVCTASQNGCLSCERGSRFSPFSSYVSYGECLPCSRDQCCVGGNSTETCASCLEDMSGCKTCHVGKFPLNGVCVFKLEGECWPEGRDPELKIDHCISCKKEEEGCALCEVDYRNQDGRCVEKGKYSSADMLSGMSVFVMGIIVALISLMEYV